MRSVTWMLPSAGTSMATSNDLIDSASWARTGAASVNQPTSSMGTNRILWSRDIFMTSGGWRVANKWWPITRHSSLATHHLYLPQIPRFIRIVLVQGSAVMDAPFGIGEKIPIGVFLGVQDGRKRAQTGVANRTERQSAMRVSIEAGGGLGIFGRYGRQGFTRHVIHRGIGL